MTGGARYPPRLSREGKLELTKAPRSRDRGCKNSRRFPPGEARADRSGKSVSDTQRHPFPFPCSLVYFSEGGLVDPQLRVNSLPSSEGVGKPSFTARIERPPLYRGGSASKKDGCLLPRASFGGRAFREQEDDQAAFPPPFPREKARPSNGEARDVRDERDRRDAGLVDLVCLVGRTGKPIRRTKETR